MCHRKSEIYNQFCESVNPFMFKILVIILILVILVIILNYILKLYTGSFNKTNIIILDYILQLQEILIKQIFFLILGHHN